MIFTVPVNNHEIRNQIVTLGLFQKKKKQLIHIVGKDCIQCYQEVTMGRLVTPQSEPLLLRRHVERISSSTGIADHSNRYQYNRWCGRCNSIEDLVGKFFPQGFA